MDGRTKRGRRTKRSLEANKGKESVERHYHPILERTQDKRERKNNVMYSTHY